MSRQTDKTKKIVKKTSYLQEELDEIETAMKNEGFRNLSEYVLHMVKTRNDTSNAVMRRKQNFAYQAANLNTLYNQIVAGINVQYNAKLFVKEAGRLCQELK